MQRITWYALLAVVPLVAPIGGQATSLQTPSPQPEIREIATISGVAVSSATQMPNGNVVLYTLHFSKDDGIFAYDLASKRSTLVTRGFNGELGMSRAGDRLGYDHRSRYLWTVPISPMTGAATGPAQRLSLREGDEASFSPDGRFVAYEAFKGPQDVVADGMKDLLVVVPVTGGPERIIAEFPETIHNICWSVDGKWIHVLTGRSTVYRVPSAGGRTEKLFAVQGRVEGPLYGQVVFYRPDAQAVPEGRMAYTTTSGVTGEFKVPAGARSSDWTGSIYVTKWLLVKTAESASAPASAIYELDVTSLLKSVSKR
jgi:hypothetical protein